MENLESLEPEFPFWPFGIGEHTPFASYRTLSLAKMTSLLNQQLANRPVTLLKSGALAERKIKKGPFCVYRLYQSKRNPNWINRGFALLSLVIVPAVDEVGTPP